MNWLNELRYTLKILGKNLRFTLLCTSIIFIGIAIVLPGYALIDNFALKTPSLGAGDEYAILSKRLTAANATRYTRYDAFHLQTFRAQAQSFKALHAWRDARMSVSDLDYTEGFSGAEIEPEFLQQTQVQPLLGRMLTPGDAAAETPVVLIGYEVWQNYYAAREDIIGYQSRINGELRTVVGVMPEGFGFPLGHRLWLPLAVDANTVAGEGAENLAIAGILADGVNIEEANNEIALLESSILASWPEQYEHIRESGVLPYVYFNVGGGDIDTNALLMVLASIMLLLTFNIGNLFVARGEERIQELAVRSAVGAVRARVALALLLESFLVCVAGLLVGWVLAYLGMSYLEGALVNAGGDVLIDFFWWDFSVNGRMVSVSLLTMALVWVASGGLAAWRISRTDLSELLGGSSKGLGDQGTTRISRVLVNIQLVFACVLLTVGFTSFKLSFNEQITTRTDSDNLYSGRITLNPTWQTDTQARQAYLDTFRQVLLNNADIDDAAFGTSVPGSGSGRVPYGIEGEDAPADRVPPMAFRVSVSDHYFDLIGVDVVEGRSFGVDDTANSLPVVVVDQRLADRVWPGESALGKRLQLNPAADSSKLTAADSPWLTVVGVAEPAVMEGSLRAGETGLPVIYQPIQQSTFGGQFTQLALLVSASAPTFDYLNAIRTAAAEADRDTPISNVQSLSTMEQDRLESQDFNRNGIYAVVLIAIYLTGAATYGLAARAAGRRRIETGIRMALGASPAACIRVFLGDGCKTVFFGLGIGTVLAIAASWFMVYNSDGAADALRSLIPTTITLALVMGTLVLLANYFPARKIVAMEPSEALRYE